MARNRQRARERKQRKNDGMPDLQQPLRENVPGSLDHASGAEDIVEASIVAGAGGEPAGLSDSDDANLSAEELTAINSYVDKGGRLMVSAGPFNKSNAGDLVKRFGLSFGGGIIIDQQLQVRNAQGGILQVTNYGNHVVSRGLSNLPAVLLGANSVDGKTPTGYTETPIIASQSDACERTDITNAAATCGPGDQKGPFNVLVAVEQSNAKSGSKPIRS